MSTEANQKSKGRYLYRSARIGDRVVRQYLGRASDPVVDLLSRLDRLTRAEQTADIAEVHSEQVAFKRLEPSLNTLTRQTREAIRIWMAGRRYQQFQGGWKPMETANQNPARASALREEELPTRELIEHLVNLANRGDREAADRLRRLIRTHRSLWEPVGDLSRLVERTLVDMISKGNLVLRESLMMKLDDMRESLRSEGGDEADQLLVDHMIVTWLESHQTRMASLLPQQNLRDGKFWDERNARANARYLAAIRELIAVREMRGDATGATHVREVVKMQKTEGTSDLCPPSAGHISPTD